MRSQFIQAESLEAAHDAAPWAAEIVEVEGGYMAFESLADYKTWAAQQ
jgi:hypothetical protein